MTPIEIIQKYGVEYLGRYYSSYRALVISNDDPNEIGALKIFIPSIHGGLTVWARPRSFGGGPKFGFKYITPSQGEVVYVEFESGDPLRPLWSYHGWATLEKPEELNNDTFGFITPEGNKVLMSEKNGTLYIHFKGNIEIKTDKVFQQWGEEIHLNEGNVGIPQTTNVVERLNAIEEKVNSYIEAMKNSPPISPGDKGLAFKNWMIAQVSNELTKTLNEDIESKTIKQIK